MSGKSVCEECVHYLKERLFDKGPITVACEEEMNNFLLSEGCWRFEQMPEEDDV